MKREIDRLYVDDVQVPERRREVNRERVAQLAESMKKLGLMTPISVWTGDNENVYLVAGRHRLEAAKSLGWDRIDGVFVEMDERERRMWEIVENLHRAELTVLERGELEAEWIRLRDADQHGQVAQFESRREDGRGHHPEGGLSAITRELGVERTEARRAIKIDALSPEVKAEAKILHLDNNQSALLNAAKQPTPHEQIRSLRQAAARKADRGEVSASERRIETAVKAVKRLSQEEMLVFADWFDAYREDGGATVFDVTAAGKRMRKRA